MLPCVQVPSHKQHLFFSAFNTARWERLQRDKEELEKRFEMEVRRLQQQQQAELLALEDKLKSHYAEQQERLQEEHLTHLERIRFQHQDQVSSRKKAASRSNPAPPHLH